MKEVLRERSSILLLLVPLWILGSYGLWKAEYVSLRIIPVMLLNSAEKEAMTVKPIDALANKAGSIIPEGSTVYFFSPVDVRSSMGGFYAGRIKYQLYGRKITVVVPEDPFEISGLRKGDYLLFITPQGALSETERDLSALVALEKLYERIDERGSQAIYRVKGEGPGDEKA